MARETRIIVRPTGSRFPWQRWYWAVERRVGTDVSAYGTEDSIAWGTWFVSAYGHARTPQGGEDRAKHWLDEEELTIKQRQWRMEAAVEKSQRMRQQTRIITIEGELT